MHEKSDVTTLKGGVKQRLEFILNSLVMII